MQFHFFISIAPALKKVFIAEKKSNKNTDPIKLHNQLNPN